MFEMIMQTIKEPEDTGPHPVGQITFTTTGLQTWVVPEGVRRVSVICIGPGQMHPTLNKNDSIPGRLAGGSRVYMNNIKVTAGAEISIQVGLPGYNEKPTGPTISSALGLIAGPYNVMVVPPDAIGHPGGPGYPMVRSGLYFYGGSTADFFGSGRGGIEGFNSSAYWPGGFNPDVTAYIPYGTSPGVRIGSGAIFSNSFTMSTPPGNGAVRIIWGNDRAYPNQNVDNQPEIPFSEL